MSMANEALRAAESLAGDHAPDSASAPREAVSDDLSAPESPTERLRLAAAELDRDGRWGGAADATTALAAWLRAEADRPERTAWDDRVLRHAADLADQILAGGDR